VVNDIKALVFDGWQQASQERKMSVLNTVVDEIGTEKYL
jgi:hypothetical protein